jgi:BlaI family penicillinase repressor
MTSAAPRSPKPTDAELAILRVLWARGPSTVRDVFDVLNAGRAARDASGAGGDTGASPSKPVGYTTVLKFMQIMADKGLLDRDASQRTHVYRAAAQAGEQQTQRRLVKDLLDRAFGGSMRKLVMQALASTKASPEELAEIRRLLDQPADVAPNNTKKKSPRS